MQGRNTGGELLKCAPKIFAKIQKFKSENSKIFEFKSRDLRLRLPGQNENSGLDALENHSGIHLLALKQLSAEHIFFFFKNKHSIIGFVGKWCINFLVVFYKLNHCTAENVLGISGVIYYLRGHAYIYSWSKIMNLEPIPQKGN